jgi:tetratricopeptide (TPR) repeat protein
LIQYHQATALREAGKLEEARALFDTVTRNVQDRPEGWDAALRAGQCQKEQGEKRIADGRKMLASTNKPEDRAKAEKLISDGVNDLRSAVAYLANQEGPLKSRKVEGDAKAVLDRTRSRLMYEAAWGWRAVADIEIEAAREKLRLERLEKRRADLSKGRPAGSPPPQVTVARVRLSEVPVQPAETQARTAYENLIKTFPELAVNADARFELAELQAMRGGHAAAIKMLQGALEGEREPSPELTDKIKLRLGACMLDQGTRQIAEAQRKLALGVKPTEKAGLEKQIADGKKKIESAMEQLQAVTSNEKSKVLTHAVYREAECLLQLGKTDEAIKLLVRFRDVGPYQNVPGLSDRALLRLGAALSEQAKSEPAKTAPAKWEQARGAYQAVIDRTGGNSPWTHEARYGIAWMYQSTGKYGEAVNTYNQVIAGTTTELAARAQLNIGLCRLAEKKPTEAVAALLVVPFTYDYPEVNALALLEAARALHEDKKTGQAVNLLKRVIRDYPESPQAAAARKQLTDLGES